jgi:hypothetical protein
MLAKKTSKNQLTLPKDVIKDFADVQYFDVTVKEKKIVLTPVKIAPVDADLSDVREKMAALGITENDVDKAVKWARKKER